MAGLNEQQAKEILFKAQMSSFPNKNIPEILAPLYGYIEQLEAEAERLRKCYDVTNQSWQDLKKQLEVTENALELAVQSDASNLCVFNGIEKELWPDYCKPGQGYPEHKICVRCWKEYYLQQAKEGEK